MGSHTGSIENLRNSADDAAYGSKPPNEDTITMTTCIHQVHADAFDAVHKRETRSSRPIKLEDLSYFYILTSHKLIL